MIDKKKKYKLGDFNYSLPKKFIAQYPETKRDYSKLMVVHKDSGEIEHRKFYNIVDYMRKNDLLVVNNTKVFPARLFATKDRTDAKVEVFLLRELSENLWEVMVRPARKVRIGNKLVFTKDLMCDVIDNTVSGGRVVRFEYEKGDFHEIIDKIGTSPLPPYINREADKNDKKRYQTVYASSKGAVAAPTAGLHFTDKLLTKIKSKDIDIENITLNIGPGTFLPLRNEEVEKNNLHSEQFYISEETAKTLNEAYKNNDRRIISVGTTSLRALESSFDSVNYFKPLDTSTNIFIYPGKKIKSIDGFKYIYWMFKSKL